MLDTYRVATEFLATWHSYRIPILLAIFAVALFTNIYRNSEHRIKTPLASFAPPSPYSEKDESLRNSVKPKIDEHSVARVTTEVTEQQAVSKTNSRLFPGPKRVTGNRKLKDTTRRRQPECDTASPSFIKPILFFTSLTGTTERYAKDLAEGLRLAAQERINIKSTDDCGLLPPEIQDLSYIDFDDYFVSAPKPPVNSPTTRYIYLFIIPTYNVDTILNTFLSHLDETHHDFRIDTAPLAALLGYSVFGLGDKEGWPTEGEGFCSQAKEIDRWMAKLTDKRRAYPVGMGDVKSSAEASLKDWTRGLVEVLDDLAQTGSLGEGAPGSGDPLESDEEDLEDGERPAEGSNAVRPSKDKQGDAVLDVEDIQFGISSKSQGNSGPIPIDFTIVSKSQAGPVNEMVPAASPTYAALTKQGYTIVGSHSGVKICRWTKSALRGRGSCYKYSFYGIKSHLCMETTPSLSCSNKCVFCWRHGTNPVGTTWRWKVDPPEMIFNGVKEGHYKKIKMMRAIPGVRAERFAEAMRIRHCALSLVGEPIFYPHINEFVGMLHNEHISSFLVCNAQHPTQLEALDRVTQLYVSIDASNRESLRKIDRPLHRDFWERFNRCLDILREKRDVQRTVFRLTLVKGFNIEDEVVGYANLIEKALPCFVEVKGVTYCGTSTSAGAGLTMKNVPFYEEVVVFVTALNDELQRRNLGYGIAAEHAHSCCILLASNRFCVNGMWHTRIDYDRFFELLERERSQGIGFSPEDYMAKTEDWALWGNGGFDPSDTRVYRKGKKNKENVVSGTTSPETNY